MHHIILMWQTTLIPVQLLGPLVYLHISSTVLLIDFCNRRIRHHFLELSVPFQEAPTGKLQTSEQPWQLLLFFLQLSNAAEWNLGLWWSLRKWGVFGFHMSTSHFHWAPRCLSSWCGTRGCLLWRQIDVWVQSKTGLLQHNHVQTPPPISNVLYQLQKKILVIFMIDSTSVSEPLLQPLLPDSGCIL